MGRVWVCRIWSFYTGLIDESYADVMDDLSSAWRKTSAPLTLPDTNDEYWVHTNNNVFEVLEKLGLSKPIPKPESKKKGRPPKKSG